ncbi:MAG: hypothetical protein WD407_12610, partial [Rhodospirillales bacterium]
TAWRMTQATETSFFDASAESNAYWLSGNNTDVLTFFFLMAWHGDLDCVKSSIFTIMHCFDALYTNNTPTQEQRVNKISQIGREVKRNAFQQP